MGLSAGLGWVVALFLLILVVVRDSASWHLRRLVAAGVDGLERRLAANRWVRARSLARYRATVGEALALVPVPFALPTAIPMRDVYIPLAAADRSDETAPRAQVHPVTVPEAWSSTLVLGPPGSGKSLLLRYLLWSSCVDSNVAGRSDNPLAVLVPLSKLAESGDVLAEIANALARYGFLGADLYVRGELSRKQPDLLVLFDGLDDVGSQERRRVAHDVEDFALRYPAVRFVVACRSEVYDGSLDDVVSRVLHIQPFGDESVERFLHAWPLMSSQESIDRLVNALRTTPQLALMARNPLLLTLLAYLYTVEYDESTGLLPINRAWFYRDATDLLLRRWQQHHNRYRSMDKQLVLRRLALVMQGKGADRRGLRYEEALAEMRHVLPSLDLAPYEAPDLLDEIVERSGLLIRLEGSELYQFAHLTMQEYLASVELLDHPQEILSRYRDDPFSWREPLKLWCGGEQDSTYVIRTLHDLGDEDSRLLALECLAEATRVDDGCADELLAAATEWFTQARTEDPIVRLFGVLASDLRPRGQGALDFLLGNLRSQNSTTREERDRVIAALTATNLPSAADAVVDLAIEDDAFVPYLVALGNVAVAALARIARDQAADRALRAIHCLSATGTPHAAQVLAQLQWHDEQHEVARRAAVALARLSPAQAVEDGLVATELPGHVMSPDDQPTDWVWRPFANRHGGSERRRLLRIFGRCRTLLDELTDEDLRGIDCGLDERLLLAVLFFRANGRQRLPGGWLTVQRERSTGGWMWPRKDRKCLVMQIGTHGRQSLLRPPRSDGGKALVSANDNPWETLASLLMANERLAACLRPELIWRFLEVERTEAPPAVADAALAPVTVSLPRTDDWEAIAQNGPSFRFDGSLFHRFPLVTELFIVLASIPFAVRALWTTSGWGRLGATIVATGLVVGAVLFLPERARRHLSLDIWDRAVDALYFVVASPSVALGIIWDQRPGSDLKAPGRGERFSTIILSFAYLGFTLSWIFGLVVWLHPPGWTWAAATIAALATLVLVPILMGQRKKRPIRNPLHGLLVLSPDTVE